jgi:hypothetical protein
MSGIWNTVRNSDKGMLTIYLNVIGVNLVFGKNIEGGVVGSTQENAAPAVVSANLNKI